MVVKTQVLGSRCSEMLVKTTVRSRQAQQIIVFTSNSWPGENGVFFEGSWIEIRLQRNQRIKTCLGKTGVSYI